MANQFLELLKTEHKEVKKVMNLIDKTDPDDKNERKELFSEFKKLIEPHMEGEETLFYPKLFSKEGTAFDAKESDEEHKAARNIMQELEGLNYDHERWGPKFHVLKEMIEHHIEEEESDLFKEANKKLNDNQFNQILEDYKQNKERMLKKYS